MRWFQRFLRISKHRNTFSWLLDFDQDLGLLLRQVLIVTTIKKRTYYDGPGTSPTVSTILMTCTCWLLWIWMSHWHAMSPFLLVWLELHAPVMLLSLLIHVYKSSIKFSHFRRPFVNWFGGSMHQVPKHRVHVYNSEGDDFYLS